MKGAWFQTHPVWDGDSWFEIVMELGTMEPEVQRDVGFSYVVNELGDIPRPVFMDAGLYNNGVGLYNSVSPALKELDILNMHKAMGFDKFCEMPIVFGDHDILEPHEKRLYIPNDHGWNRFEEYIDAMFGKNRRVIVLPECYRVYDKPSFYSTYLINNRTTKLVILGSNTRLSYRDIGSSLLPTSVELKGRHDDKRLIDGVINTNSIPRSVWHKSAICELVISGWDKPSILITPPLPKYKNFTFENVTFPHKNQKAFAYLLDNALETPALVGCTDYKQIVNACSRATREKLVVID